MRTRRLTCLTLTLALTLLAGCAPRVVWKDRQAPVPGDASHTQPVPTCPKCGQVVDYDATRCSNPEQPIRLTWWEPEVLD